MVNFNKSLVALSLNGLLISLSLMIIMQPVAQAYPGLADGDGYFNAANNPGATHDSVLPWNLGSCLFTGYGTATYSGAAAANFDSNAMALPRYSTDTKSELRDFLKDRYNDNACGGWTVTGVSFIIHTMLGHTPGRSASLSAQDWTDFDDKIVNNSDITMTYESGATPTYNSHGSGFHYAGDKDDYFYSTASPTTEPMYKFSGTGYSYGLKLRCANPSGDINVSLPQWTITGSSTISLNGGAFSSGATAKPGDNLRWSHSIHNEGPDGSPNIDYWAGRDSSSNPGYSGHTGSNSIALDSSGPGSTKTYNGGSAYTITQDDVSDGDGVCQRAEWKPRAWNDSNEGNGSWVCASVPYNYGLTPILDPLPNSVAEAGGIVSNITSHVDNVGPTKSRNAEWQLSRLTLAPGVAIPNDGGGASSDEPCVYFGAAVCNNADSGNRVFGVGGTAISAFTATIEDLEVGTKVCYALSVKTRTHDVNSGWQNSAPQCLVVGKKPKLQVWGGDVMVRGDIDTSTSTKMIGAAARTFGSWGQYGVISSGDNSYMASGSGLSGGSANGAQSFWSKLTFANIGPYGHYSTAANLRAVPAISERFASGGSPADILVGSVNIDYFNSRDDVFYVRTGNLNIDAGILNAGKSVILNVTGTVTISGNIEYTGDLLTSIAQIPQIVIMANTVNIKDTVERVDSWLITPSVGGKINTCSHVGPDVLNDNAELSSKICDKRLTINGPVVTKALYLRRTAGSGVGLVESDYPAEVINLRPDAYLWAYQRASGTGRAQTVMTTELAPRF